MFVMKKTLLTITTLLFISQFVISQIWLNPITTGRPISTNYLGDKLSASWYFQFEIGQASWNASEVGIGQNSDGSTGWSWASAGWYADGSGSNKKVQRNIGDFQFTNTGTWYVVGRAKANLGDAFTYADEGTWSNSTTLTASTSTGSCPYFTVSSLSDPTTQTATASSNTQNSLSWTKWNSKNVMVVRRLTSAAASNAPNQGTAYTVGNTLGTGTVVYNGGGTSFNDTGLTPGTDYTYIFYSENYSYYSIGSTATATTTAVSSSSDYFRSKSTGNWNTAGSWESSANGSSNWITATLVPGSSASGITILSGHNITLDANISVSNLIISSGATFTASDATPRILTISKSTAGSSTTLSNSGTWANGTGGSTVVFTGAPSGGDAIHAISGSIAFQNLTVNKTGGSSNVGASFGSSSSLSGTLEIGSGGFISTNPPSGFYSVGSILKFNQGALATYDVNSGDKTWSTTEIPQNITVASGKVRVNENRTATGSLIISTDATLELSAAKQLNISTALTNNGNLTLKSAENVGTATIITTGTVDGSGTTTVEQFVSSVATGATGRNWYISSPLSAATSSTITTATGNTLVKYSGGWVNAGTTMDVMTGYVALSPAQNTTIQFTGGSLNTGNKSVINLPAGFNLIGNPYASYVDFAQASKTAVANSIWYRSKSSGSYVFQTYNVTGGTGVNDGTAIIPPMQSFWIKTTNATNSLEFTNAMRSHQDQSVAANRLKTPALNTQKLLRLEVSSGANKDEAVVYFNENALNTFDDYDSQKMFSEIADVPEIFTFTDNKNLVINGYNSLQLNTEIPVGFRTDIDNAGQKYTIKSTQFDNFDNDTELVLIDKVNNNLATILSEGTAYEFESSIANSTSRFSVLFRTKGTATGGCCFNTFENKISIQKNDNNQLVVKCDATITIYNASGQKLTEQGINNSSTIINATFKAGVYLIKFQSEGKTYNVKIAI